MDKRTDVAVVKIEARDLPKLPLGDSSKVRVGEWVLAIGSPFGLENTVTAGIVSAKSRDTGDYLPFIQTDVAVNPGNSGGALVDAQGRIIGVNSAIATLGSSLGSQTGSIGLGFAIPINQARRTAQQLISTGKAVYPIMGISVDMQYQGRGALIAKSPTAIKVGGPAAKAGLKAGDLITALDGKSINTAEELIVTIRSHSVGDQVKVTYLRGNISRDVTLILTAGK